MTSLSFYQTAATIKKLVKEGDQYVEITQGVRRGSIAKIVEIVQENYSSHRYRLLINKKRPFWITGSFLAHLPNYKGETRLVKATAPFPHYDILNRKIEVGTTVMFSQCCKACTNSNVPDMIIATVRKQNFNGNLYVSPIKIGKINCKDISKKLIRLVQPEKCIIIDRQTSETVMIYKLSN